MSPPSDSAEQGAKLSLTAIRDRQVNMLKAIARHCADHSLTYYLYKGTLLGAVRHAGWIPWDDDLDIAMPRADYEEFCHTFQSRTSSEADYSLRSLPGDPDYGYPFAKVSDNRTVLRSYSETNRNPGVFVDIFPLDGWRRDKIARSVQQTGYALLRQLLRVKRLKPSNVRSPAHRTALVVGKLFLRSISARSISSGISALAMLGGFNECEIVGDLVWHREKVPRAAFDHPSPVPFEGDLYPGPGNPDQVLRCLYGNYLLLPPIAEQVRRHKFTAYLKEQQT